MTWAEILWMAVIQGLTELFPVSSLGHSVVVPKLLGLGIDGSDPGFLAFLVILHFGTAGALLVYFWRDWSGLLVALSPKPSEERRKAWRLIFMLIIGTLPVAVLGLVFNHAIKALFASPSMVAVFLIANAALLYFGERVSSHARTDLNALTWRQALFVGSLQCLALLPGISRSGATIIGGLMIGLSEAEAAHLSFLLATPAILGAGVLEIPKLLHMRDSGVDLTASLAGGVLAAFCAYLSIVALMAWMRYQPSNALKPFAGYCLILGVVSLIVFEVMA